MIDRQTGREKGGLFLLLELGDQHSAVIMVKTRSGKNHQWMLPLGRILMKNSIYVCLRVSLYSWS